MPSIMPPYLLLALVSACAYSIGSLFNKQAMAGGCGEYRVAAFTVWATALLLLPFVFFYTAPLPVDRWIEPLTTAVCFSSGIFFFIRALRTGDLSLVAPVSGVKPVLNAVLIATLLRTPVAAGTWAACLLTLIALLILRTPNISTPHSFLRTAVYTLLSALSFALCDTCFQQWAADWGILRFGAITFSLSSLAALGLIPFFCTPWKAMSRTARRHALAGAIFCALPGLFMSYALGRYGHAAEVNVVYSTRALWSLFVVRLLGHRVGSREQHISRTVFLRRLLGTAVLMGAVALVLSLGD
jgi:drug/metabolite transporter (DMT)-like permease